MKGTKAIAWIFLPAALACCGPAPESPYPAPGEVVALGYADNDTPGFLAADMAAYTAMVKAARAEDRDGTRELFEAGRILPVDAGVKARVLEVDVGSRGVRVRVSEGPATGRAGWAMVSFIRRGE
jgi:hypothetical protein